jgi:CheY-like chemotaxis protein/predicted regulator of Ras-like GTPase activity (Roadblock/LC7/MglB family)
MAPRILVVDGNAAFATVLKEMLEGEGGYEVRVASTGSDALAVLERHRIHLTIVDMDLDPGDMDYRALVRRVRQMLPTMRLVLIPLMGQAVPPEAHGLQIQGVLSKPFFADDLLPCIDRALAAPLGAAAPKPATRAGRIEPAPRLQELLLDLARETRAELVAVLSLEGKGRVVAQVGKPGGEAAESLAGLGLEALQAGQRLARFLGQPDHPFEHNMFESQSFRVYVLSLPGDLGLLLAAPLGDPLGAVRQNLRRAGRELAGMPLT